MKLIKNNIRNFFFNELCVIIPGVGGVLPRVSAPCIPVVPKLPLLVGFIAYSFDDLADAYILCFSCISSVI